MDKTNSYFELDIKSLRRLLNVTSSDALSEDVLVADICHISDVAVLRQPYRFDGYLAFFCYEGEFTMEVNLDTIQMKNDCLLMCSPGNIFRVAHPEDVVDSRFHVGIFAISRTMLTSMNLDIGQLYDEGIELLDAPCVVLDEEERSLCRKYMTLVNDISRMDTAYSRIAFSTLFASMIYLLFSLWDRKMKILKEHDAMDKRNKEGRTKVVLKNFIALVKEYHGTEHELNFYADKMYMTPKYLSKVIKDASGRTAHDWIDAFVVLESKNLLKYSEMTMKEIVSRLNFSSQSAFCRYFRAKTGVSPAEFRRGKI